MFSIACLLTYVGTMKNFIAWFPIAYQAKHYSKSKALQDVIAALVVTIMLIPQSLAYAMLAGLPPHYGLYASILPLLVYSLLGSSTALAVGPVAIASIMTASTLSAVVDAGLIAYVDGAITLALLSGAMLVLLGVFKFGFVANFLSHTVVSGFISASSLIIALSQLRHLLGISVSGHTFFELLKEIFAASANIHLITVYIGFACLFFLVLARKYASGLLQSLGVTKAVAKNLAKMTPIVAVVISTAVVAMFSLHEQGVAVVGEVPSGLASPQLPSVNIAALKSLMLPAFFIALIGYVESISVGRTLGAKRGEKVEPNQELLALGGANLTAGLAGAFPVTGGFSRSVVNFEAGAQTQFSGIYTAIGIAFAAFAFTPLLYYLPIAMLAATIIVAVLSLADFSLIKHAWHFSKSDFSAIFITIAVTLAAGVEAGVASGIVSSILLHLYLTSVPHVAEIGLVPHTEHFRNIKNYQVELAPNTVSLRIDESLLFTNADFLESYIGEVVQQRKNISNIILHCGAVNTIDLSGMEMLIAVNNRLLRRNIKLHLSEVKMPVKHLLCKAKFLDRLSGGLYLSHLQAHRAMFTSHK